MTKPDRSDQAAIESAEQYVFEEEAEKHGTDAELGAKRMAEKEREHTDSSPTLSGGDVDAAWEEDAVGEENVGGGNPTPDQDIVEEIGQAMGVTFEDNEPLDFTEKLEKRDRDRWELNPASADEFEE